MKNKQLEEATAYFEQIDQIIRQFREERTLITNQIRDIAETDGWDSTECARLREYEARMRFPVSSGTNKAWLAWRDNVAKDNDEFIVSDFLWDFEAKNFTETLSHAGIRTFVYVNTGIRVMENIPEFVENGYVPTGLYRMEYINDAKDETMVAAIVKLGIRFEYRSVDN